MASRTSSSNRSLFDLAKFHGVQTSYRDAFGKYQFVDVDALVAIIHGLGIELAKPQDAAQVLEEHERVKWDFNLEPVIVLWDQGSGTVSFRVPENVTGNLHCSLEYEDGNSRDWEERLEELPITAGKELSGQRYITRSISLPSAASGYHRLAVDFGGRRFESLVIAAPKRAYETEGRYRGFFAPLYALHGDRSWGVGDVRDLDHFAAWLDEQEADFVATLPLLPASLEQGQFSPSPYSPVSRLFWNELYADPLEAAKALGNKKALEWFERPVTQERLQKLRSTDVVDYLGTFEMKREMLGILAADAPPKDVDPAIAEYARFRAVREKQRAPWREWPERLKRGDFSPSDYDDGAFAFYATAQQIISQQLAELSSGLKARGQQCYLDLPIGSDANGFDTWKHQSLFAHTVQCGAPPDQLFISGQAWGLPPMIPDQMRRSGYEHLRAVIRHHLSLADILRYDHVIGLHRLYWVPDGFSARKGIFVQYPSEELYAILSLESHRAQSVIVGENLGTVPEHINNAMRRHRIYETYVLQFEIPSDPSRRIRPAPRRSFAGLNTHDMPTFAGFMQGKDLKIQESLGLRDAEGVAADLEERAKQIETLCGELESQGLLQQGVREPDQIFRAATAMLSNGRAKYVVTNLEDLWLETEGHNVPGTATGNWERRLARSMDELPDPMIETQAE